MPDRPRNIGTSIRQRLLNLAQMRGQPLQVLLTRYALERLLHRLSLTPHRERFVLKGAMLLAIWFDLKGLRIEPIREAVEPGTEEINLPVLLDMPSPHLLAYPPETVIAEKFHAMVVLGQTNSRMKDYYDMWMLTSTFELEEDRLRRAIEATFTRRNTELPAMVPDGLSDAFAADPAKQRQWDIFTRDLTGPIPRTDNPSNDEHHQYNILTAPFGSRAGTPEDCPGGVFPDARRQKGLIEKRTRIKAREVVVDHRIEVGTIDPMQPSERTSLNGQ